MAVSYDDARSTDQMVDPSRDGCAYRSVVAPGVPSGGFEEGPTEALLEELAEMDATFEGAPPAEVLEWAYGRFGEGVVLTSSFQDAVLVDLAGQVHSPLEVVFLDTGFHFEETIDYLEELSQLLGLKVTRVRADLLPSEYPCGSPACCAMRKVEPLARVLSAKAAWVTGVKRVDTPERASARTIAWDPGKGVVKVNPIVTWSEADVEAYVTGRRLPRHPLNAKGYLSIGCAPTTQPVSPGEGPRAGRWSGIKTECGLHL